MRAGSENYKGIEYVQISSLPLDQKKSIYKSLNHNRIILILKDETLLSDCLQYHHYVDWYENVYSTVTKQSAVEVERRPAELRLAFK